MKKVIDYSGVVTRARLEVTRYMQALKDGNITVAARHAGKISGFIIALSFTIQYDIYSPEWYNEFDKIHDSVWKA